MTADIPPDAPCLFCGRPGCDRAARYVPHKEAFRRLRGGAPDHSVEDVLYEHTACREELERAADEDLKQLVEEYRRRGFRPRVMP